MVCYTNTLVVVAVVVAANHPLASYYTPNKIISPQPWHPR